MSREPDPDRRAADATALRAAADAEAILHAAVAAADPAGPVRAALADAPELRDAAPVTLLGIGKAACRMRAAALDVLHARVAGALTVVPHGTSCDAAMHASHPLPDPSSERAGRAVRELVERAPPDALLLVLLSGGASSLATLPADDIDIDAYADCVLRLQRAGADIRQLNTVRKHIDQLKGGRLAALAAPRRVLGLILSDVVGDNVDVIASGPLSPDHSTPRDAIAVLRSLGVWQSCAPAVRATLERSAADAAQDSDRRSGDFDRVRTVVIGGNALARAGAAAEARHLGYIVDTVLEPITGEARHAASAFAGRALELQQSLSPGAPPVCLIAGGETTVTVRGTGRGGRNQELVLAAALALEKNDGITIGSIGTDGVDGSSDAAGAVANSATIRRAHSRGIDPAAFLERNDSATFFRTVGGRIVTGPTGTNVMDVQVALVHPRADARGLVG